MVDNLLKKNWHGATECSLCLCQQETSTHLTQCNFTEALWNLVASRFSLPSFAVMRFKEGPIEWTNSLLASGSNKDRRKKIGILFCLWWLVWKEKNPRIFDDRQQFTLQVFALLQDQVSCLYRA
jgi:hypothetical protein